MTGIYSDDVLRLWRAVVLQALLDAGNMGIASMFPNYQPWKIKQIRDEARDWIRVADKDFTEVCENANLDPRIIRQFGMKVIRGDSTAKHNLLKWKYEFRQNKRIGEKTDDS
tara:strand:- start:396 stop:731 length:336 start_codon:yes stop_codon:yes gene_type:complete